MSNLRDNIQAEIQTGTISETFTLKELSIKFESNGYWVINGCKYASKHVKSIFANYSIGPGNRKGEAVKKSQNPLFVKHEGLGTYSVFTKKIAEKSIDTIASKYNFSASKKNLKIEHENLDHFEVLGECIRENKNETWPGFNIRKYAENIADMGLQIPADELPDKKFSRSHLFEFVSSPENSTLTCCIAICAWGGMNRSHCYKAFKAWEHWEDVVNSIRSGEITRGEAYDRFFKLRKSNMLSGMGPAYYTKLIYFLSHEKNRGYIMDQWTARSFNLLANQIGISLSISKKTNGEIAATVRDENDFLCYEKFCSYIEELATSFKVSADEVEMNMFSQGRKKGKWRNYLKNMDLYLYN